MRDPERIDKVLKLIEKIWKRYPDWRLCQLIINSLRINYDPYYIEDDTLYDALKRINDKDEKKLKGE